MELMMEAVILLDVHPVLDTDRQIGTTGPSLLSCHTDRNAATCCPVPFGSALFFPQRRCNVTQVQRVSWYGSFPATFRGLAGINLHRFGDGVHRAFPEVSESLPCVLLADALLEGLALVPELDDGLRVGV